MTCQAACSPVMLPGTVDCWMAVVVNPAVWALGCTSAFQPTSAMTIWLAVSGVIDTPVEAAVLEAPALVAESRGVE